MKCYIHEKTREDVEKVRDNALSSGLIVDCGEIYTVDVRLRNGSMRTEYWLECEDGR